MEGLGLRAGDAQRRREHEGREQHAFHEISAWVRMSTVRSLANRGPAPQPARVRGRPHGCRILPGLPAYARLDNRILQCEYKFTHKNYYSSQEKPRRNVGMAEPAVRQPEAGARRMAELEQQGALAGLRIIDLSRVLGGPYATQILADHGAEVIKVEPPSGDETRTWGP